MINLLNVAGFACVLELMAEPLYILSQTLVRLKLRLVVETVATVARCVTLCALIVMQTNMVQLLYHSILFRAKRKLI